MLLSVVSVLVIAQSSSEIPGGLMNNLVFMFNYRNSCGCSRVNYRARTCIIAYIPQSL